jgi:hypothetical protein
MPFRSLFASAFSLFALLGCRDYDSVTPLGAASAGWIDAELLGTWRCAPAEGGEQALVSFRQFDETQYLLMIEGDESSVFRAYSTSVGDAAFLNVQELKQSTLPDRGFTFVQYSIRDSQSLELECVGRELFEADEASDRSAIDVLEAALEEDASTLVPLLACVRSHEET